jgi:hypothetical protein
MKLTADHHDADLILKLYDLRREAVMRDSRNAMFGFLPKNYDEFVAILAPNHPLNAAFRQTSSYWEMAYSFAKHGVVHADMLIESSAEGLFLYAKALPYLERLRKDYSPTMFSNAQWIVAHSPVAAKRLELIQARVAKMIEAK